MAKAKTSIRTAKIGDFLQDDKNANRGTKPGRKLIQQSLTDYGAGRSILIDRKGRIMAGNKTAIGAADAKRVRTEVRRCDPRAPIRHGPQAETGEMKWANM
jgi:hypothetical protein